MVLQRQRLSESHVLDQRTRHILHDDILPRLHTALLELSRDGDSSALSHSDTITLLAEIHREISNLLLDLPGASTLEVSRLGVFEALRQVLDGELKDGFDAVSWQIPAEVEQSARSLPPLAAEVLFFAAREAMRNSARHGRSSIDKSPLHLKVSASDLNGLELVIEDDGVGLGEAGPYTSGSKQGLALHSTMMAVVGGSLAVESLPGKLTRVLLTLPRT
jgi:signal transduction histidine kinase